MPLDANQFLVQVSAHVRRIEAVEKDLKALGDASASKEDISRVRAEVKKIYDGLHIGKWNWNFMISNLNPQTRVFGSTDTCVGNS